MSRARIARDERGIALVTVLLVAFAVSGIALACAMWILNAGLITRSGERNSTLHDIAVAGLEEGRSQINGTPALYPAVNFNTLENNVTVTDAAGATVPNVRRSTYVGPDGLLGGQYGVFGTLISVVTDNFGNRAVRRLQINQESFAKFAYFTNVEGAIQFANNDQIRGPVHSNDRINIAATGATFFDSLTTSNATINGEANGTFPGPAPRKSAPVIPMPTTAAFAALQVRANNAGMSFVSNNTPRPAGQAPLRIDFVALDLNGDLDSTDAGEGFIRIYQDNARPWYVTGTLSGVAGNDIRRSPNCGAAIPGGFGVGTNGRFRTAFDTNPGGLANGQATNLLVHANRRCYLGGDPRLSALAWPAVNAADWAAVVGTWPLNQVGWRPRPVGMGAPTLIAAFMARPDNAYLWPISREYNPLWEGVIYVAGRVAVSGVVNGRVTVATPNNIVVGDDLRMAVDPGSAAAADCAMIAGLFSGDSIMVSDNTLNSSQQIAAAGAWRLYDETTQEDIHATLLTLDIFGAENYANAPNNAQLCGATPSGRGCLNLSGGVIQNSRGPVGLTDGTGYIKRYSYNTCSSSDPPPYFPTTGRFVRNRIYELDPKGFDVAAWFAANQNN